jgi:hypothetical protein
MALYKLYHSIQFPLQVIANRARLPIPQLIIESLPRNQRRSPAAAIVISTSIITFVYGFTASASMNYQ